MELLDKYLYAISRKLPKDNKEEIIEELRSSLLDNLEDQYGENPSESQIAETIQAFGSPISVAHRYGKSRSLISPVYTELYKFIMKLIVFGLLGSFTIAFLVKLIAEGQDVNIAIEFASILGSTLQASLSAFGALTMVFMLITYFAGDSLNDEIETQWNPKDLEELPSNKEKVKFGETLAGILFSILFLVAFNLYPEMINMPSKGLITAGFNVHTVDVAHFKDFLLPLNLIWIATIIHAIILLVKMRYTKGLRFIEIFISFASLALFYVMITDQPLYTLDNYAGPKGFFILMMVITGIDILSNLIQFFFRD